MAGDRAADVVRLRQHLQANPRDALSWHNLAAAEGDLGRSHEAEEAARRALALGVQAPETLLVLARALQQQGSLDEAERTFEECLGSRPAYAHAHRDLAQLRWMRTGDLPMALRALESALAEAPGEAALHLVHSIVLEFSGDLQAARRSVEAGLARAPADVELLRHAAHVSAEIRDPDAALRWARRAAAIAPGVLGVGITLCEALLAAGRAAEASSEAERLRALDPLDQHAIALQATAWRLTGDPRYRQYCDYATLVASERLPSPAGWSTLDSFLTDLKTDLEALHLFESHPFQQSVRGGGQLPLYDAELSRPVIRALFESIDGLVQRRLARLGRAGDPFRERNTGCVKVTGAWSVRLRSGGYHTDHVHPRGWLSAVFYVDLPPEVRAASESGNSHAGWLRLGHPGVETSPSLPPDAYVKPEPGLLVQFPAYIWHGVEPFESASTRLSVALDALPG